MKYFVIALFGLLVSCQKEAPYELVIRSDSIYTATGIDTADAIAITGDRIMAVGSFDIIGKRTDETSRIIDARGMFVMPGIIEGHGHFLGMGQSRQHLNFLRDTSWEDIVNKVVEKSGKTPKGQWIYGRGWHQEKWRQSPEELHEGYPVHDRLSRLTPDHPVMLVHASGHALFANQQAMDAAGIQSELAGPAGGRIIRDGSGRMTGVFEERAMDPIKSAYSSYLEGLDKKSQDSLWKEAVLLAQEECIRNGVTSFQDAGSSFEDLRRYRQLAEANELDIRLWAMLRESSEEMEGRIKNYRIIGAGNNHFTCRAIKTELDGALGSHGAWLLEPYADKPGFTGQNTTALEEVERIAEQAYNNRMQLCTHAIGDRANKEILDIIERYHNESGEDLRWRVEHAQHLNPNDINRFKSTGAIASMQGVHCTSDAPYVVKRLGTMRAKIGAYAWKRLLDNGVVIVNGTDVPVEDISPAENFYASVSRTRLDNGMRFFVEQRMTREQALRSYTIDAAYAAFEEDIKGSIEPGKLADITILDTNWLNCEDDEIPDTKVLYTIIGGKEFIIQNSEF